MEPVETTTSDEEAFDVPVTPGRDFGVEPLWNVWFDSSYLDLSDQRNDLDINGSTGSFTIGIDRSLNEDLLAGMSVIVEHSRSQGFDDGMRSESNSFTLNPYLGYQLSPNWAVETSLGYGLIKNDQQLLVLAGDYTSQRFSISTIANGQYKIGKAFIRPKVSIYYAHTQSDGYDMTGTISGVPINLRMLQDSYNYGMIETSAEVNRTFTMNGGTSIMPYAAIAANYAFVRPNNGNILTGNLSQASTTPWSGSLRLGTRAMILRSTIIEASGEYLSLGQNGLDLWGVRLFISHSF